METRDNVHEPTILGRIVGLLSPALISPGAVHIDYALGLSGYARAVLGVIPSAKLIGIGRDPSALVMAQGRLDPLAERTTFVRAAYDRLPGVPADLGVGGAHVMLVDLRLSPLQIDREERELTYRVDAFLDMRMNRGEGRSAADLPSSAPSVELVRILYHYGEEKFMERIVATVVEEREIRSLKLPGRLVEVISNAIPVMVRYSPGYLAKHALQVPRIAVNDELATLERFLPVATTALTLKGRLVVLSYHSLEDRSVKRHLAALAADGVSGNMPVVPEHLKPRFRLLTRGTERPPKREIRSDSRTTPVRLRAATRIKETQLSALVAEVEQSTQESSRPRLRLVPPVRARVSMFGFLLMLAVPVVLGMAPVMVVTTQIEAQSRDLVNLRKEAIQLSYEAAARRTELQGVSSSGSLALHALELGMVPSPFPAFVDLSTGTILGQSRSVKGDEAPYLTGWLEARQSPEPAPSEPTRHTES